MHRRHPPFFLEFVVCIVSPPDLHCRSGSKGSMVVPGIGSRHHPIRYSLCQMVIGEEGNDIKCLGGIKIFPLYLQIFNDDIRAHVSERNHSY